MTFADLMGPSDARKAVAALASRLTASNSNVAFRTIIGHIVDVLDRTKPGERDMLSLPDQHEACALIVEATTQVAGLHECDVECGGMCRYMADEAETGAYATLDVVRAEYVSNWCRADTGNSYMAWSDGRIRRAD